MGGHGGPSGRGLHPHFFGAIGRLGASDLLEGHGLLKALELLSSPPWCETASETHKGRNVVPWRKEWSELLGIEF